MDSFFNDTPYQRLVKGLETHLQELQNERIFSFKSGPIGSPKAPPTSKEAMIMTPKIESEKKALPPIQSKPKEPPPILSFATKIEKESFDDIKKALFKLYPKGAFKAAIPSDQKAKAVKNSWREKSLYPDVPILCSSDELPFLQTVAKAISDHFFPSKILIAEELEKHQELTDLFASTNIKLILVSQNACFLSKISTSIKQIAESKYLLANHPLILLHPCSNYTLDPSLKRVLWNQICQILKTPPS